MATAKKTAATKKVEVKPNTKPDARDSLDSGTSEGNELSAIAVKSLTIWKKRLKQLIGNYGKSTI